MVCPDEVPNEARVWKGHVVVALGFCASNNNSEEYSVRYSFLSKLDHLQRKNDSLSAQIT